MKSFIQTLILCFCAYISLGQSIIGLPMAGHVTDSSVQILVITENAPLLKMTFQKDENEIIKDVHPTENDTLTPKKIIYYYKIAINDLSPNTNYLFNFFLPNLRDGDKNLSVKTLPNEDVYDFDFLIGSCLAPFKGVFFGLRPRLKIFDTMRETDADFMVWMGDNVYFLSGEWNEYESMIDKMIIYRKEKLIRRFLNHQPNYSTWDDHDFGPNNSHGDFDNKEMTNAIFDKFWENPRVRPDSLEGIFYQFSHADVDFFVMDSRYNRVRGQEMYGKAQVNWLKERLRNSDATFKFIISGTQSLPDTYGEDWNDYPLERTDFLNFLKDEDIEGVVFCSGDTHYAELNRLERENHYSLIEITSSSLTSPTFPGAEKSNKGEREIGTFSKKKNFGHISVKGEKGNRICKIEIKDRKGKIIWTYKIHERELSNDSK